MTMTPDAVLTLAAEMIEQHAKSLRKNGSLGKVARYLKGDHDLPYSPRGARAEYKTLAQKSITNWLPLISDTYAKALWVDGYRESKSSTNAKAWDYWQKNRLDARQSIPTRSALEYGVGYCVVLPGDSAPSIRPYSALKCQAVFEDDDDEWPTAALIHKGKATDGGLLYQFLDETNVYDLKRSPTSSLLEIVTTSGHDLGKCPVVRFRDRLDGEATGIIAPLLNIQDRINEAVFSLLIAIQYASFRQRWATGLAIPSDEDGNPVEPFQAAVDRLWVTDNHEAKFGDFSQTETSGHLASYESAVRTLAAIAQTPPHVLLGDLVNLSADALAAAEASTQRKGSEYETLFGESWEQVLRLAAAADGDTNGASDESAQVRWRDTEARSLASTVDALGKMAQMLQVPFEALWERIPGVTDTDVENWRAMAKSGDGLQALADALNGKAEAVTSTQALTNAAPPTAPVPAQTPAA